MKSLIHIFITFNAFIAIHSYSSQEVSFYVARESLCTKMTENYLSTNATCLIVYASSNRSEQISHPIWLPVLGKYIFKNKNTTITLEIKRNHIGIEGDLGLLRLIHLQNQSNNIVIVISPLPLREVLPGKLQADMDETLLRIMASYLDVQFACNIPGVGQTNISDHIQADRGKITLEWMATDAMTSWRAKWDASRKSRLKKIQQIRDDASQSESSMKLIANAKDGGMSFPAVDQAVWRVMARYERTTLQELDRTSLNKERQEQLRSSSGLSPYSYSSRHPPPGARTTPTSEMDKFKQACEAIKTAFTRHNPDASYLAASLVLQHKPTLMQLNQEINQAVLQGLDAEMRTVGHGEPTLRDCKVYAPGMDGKKILVMEWSAKSP
jgi:hypothetical protein